MPALGKAPPKKQHTQSVVFSQSIYTLAEAKAWCRDHGYSTSGLDTTAETFRFRQYDPDSGKFRYRNKKISSGITLVLAFPKADAAQSERVTDTTLSVCMVQNMASGEIVEMVGDRAIADIKASGDKKPLFRVFSVGHTGLVHGTLLNLGAVPTFYTYDAVRSLFYKLFDGVKVFLGHNEDNSTDDRTPIGEVRGKKLVDIGGALHALAAIYIYPKFRDKELDVASIEAEVTYEDNRPANAPAGSLGDRSQALDVTEVLKVTGIAVGNHEEWSPAFPGAVLLGTAQAAKSDPPQGETHMDLQEVKNLIREAGWNPMDIFRKEEILKLDVVAELDKRQQTNYEHARRVEESLGTERADRARKEQELLSRIGKLQQLTLENTARHLLPTVAEKRHLTEQQRKFVEVAVPRFKTEAADDDAKVQADFDNFITDQLAEYDRLAAIFKPGEGTPPPAGGGTPVPPGAGPGNTEDLTDPKNNEFIPT